MSVTLGQRVLGWVHAPADPRTFAALRIGWGALGLWTFGQMWGDLRWAMSDQGLAVDRADPWELFSTLGWTSPDAVQGVWIALLALFAAVVLGVGGRVTFAAAWVWIVAIGLRNPWITDGSDSVLRVLGFTMLLMPLTRTWSVDAWVRAKLGWAPPERPPSSWALRMFQLQVCVIYVKTGLIKSFGDSWHAGNAVFYSMSAPRFWRFHLEWLISQGWFQVFAKIATYATLVFEVGFPLVFHKRLRRWVLVAGLCLHGGIFLFLNLGSFSETIVWTYLAWVIWKPLQDHSTA